jgi:hypothetical protein
MLAIAIGGCTLAGEATAGAQRFPPNGPVVAAGTVLLYRVAILIL